MEIDIKGYKVLIDEEDYQKITELKWFVFHESVRKKGLAYFGHNTGVLEDGKRHIIYLHRFIMGMKFYDKLVVDHINGNTLDNRKSNLRICTVAENNRNMRKRKRNKSGYKGVSYAKKEGKYRAQICISGRNTHIGAFDTPEEAYAAYCEASKKYHGEFGRT